MGYEHTQKGPWYLLMYLIASACMVAGWTLRGETAAMYAFWAAGLVIALIGAAFIQMTVTDEADAIAVRYGPLPLFSTRIPYAKIRSAERGRTTLLDGWGIHWIPGRGTTYNIWGFDCVRLEVGKRTIRIGTDDADNLLAFIEGRISQE